MPDIPPKSPPPWGRRLVMPPPDSQRYKLWSHLQHEHGLTLLESELDEIIRLAVIIRYRSAASGLLYENRHAAGDLSAIVINDIEYPVSTLASTLEHTTTACLDIWLPIAILAAVLIGWWKLCH